MKALVTGGSGFIGLYMVEQLVQNGVDVRVLSRRTLPEFAQLGIEHIAGDLSNSELIRSAVKGVDVVFHVAGMTGIWGPWRKFYQVNVQSTREIIKACQENGVPRLIYTSSPSVIFDGSSHENVDETCPYPTEHLCHYSHTKAMGEQLVLESNGQGGLLTAAIRPHLVWGPRDQSLTPRVIEKATKGKLRRVGDGENLISVSYVENVAAAHLQLADSLHEGSPTAGQVYFINDPEPVKLWDWIDNLLKESGVSPLKKSVSAKTAYRAGRMLEMMYTFLPFKGEPPMTRFMASQLSQSHYYSIEKAQRDFNYTPIVSIEEGMKRWKSELKQYRDSK
ncbi:3 beta-hydroxysteroid dehydrogenase/Delta 5--_4-isomerase [Polystyrenella longa]|uniref:3 beta-hydroxysteroid dehydrogenase/Delta 5-->4-isomerase n=1 Tax=Polystyrenella longa TaxID=2528007 RepID=A0A518CQ85_9PLAN|nr:NAD-dependent epimerase/dehydratase family protein [Polystyrenella longa]QDU81396.1 3 beta-hydroxysteroid dehydrogenase/Delta 5-->4-isomerase [Polystyrenella longa]